MPPLRLSNIWFVALSEMFVTCSRVQFVVHFPRGSISSMHSFLAFPREARECLSSCCSYSPKIRPVSPSKVFIRMYPHSIICAVSTGYLCHGNAPMLVLSSCCFFVVHASRIRIFFLGPHCVRPQLYQSTWLAALSPTMNKKARCAWIL